MKKSYLPLTLILLFLFNTNYGQNTRGGEISWSCISTGPDAGKYKFQLDLYYECATTPASSTQSISIENSTKPAISVSLTSETDIGLTCFNPSMATSCANNSTSAVARRRYESSAVTLSGTPPTSGWVFTWTSCCRNNSTNLSSGQGFTLRSIMYPFKGKNADPCFDSSPSFNAPPTPVIPANHFVNLHNTAFDDDLDYIDHAFATPLNNYTTWPANAVNYLGTYSATNPTPDASVQSANVAAIIAPKTGTIRYLSYTTGNFAVGSAVNSYREGIKTATIYRDFAYEIYSQPSLPPPFPAGTFNNPPNVSITYVRRGVPSVVTGGISDTVLAGDTIRFEIQTTDFEFLPGFLQQSNILKAYGQQFGSGFSDPNNGCPYPPCATMETDPTKGFDVANQHWKGTTGVRTKFEWVVDSNHALLSPASHSFGFVIQDDYCPSPSVNAVTANFYIKATPAKVTGFVFDDLNGNGVQDPGELGKSRAKIKVDPLGYIYSTDINGFYSIRLPFGSYQISTIPEKYEVQTFPATNHSFTLTTSNRTVTNKDFGVQTIPGVQDLLVSFAASANHRPANLVSYYITYKNIGTKTMSGTVEFKHDSLLNFISAIPAPLSQSGNDLTFSFANLMPGQSSQISATLRVDSNAVLGQIATSFASIEPIASDSTPADNTTSINRLIVNSYDPNIKEVFPEGPVTPAEIANGQLLTYTIYFQNVGNAPAIDVVIEDSIKPELDFSSFEMLAASHTYDYQLLGDRIVWEFRNINLPDSASDPEGSIGFVKFRMLAQKNLLLGDSVLNRAAIFFDLNDPIITDWAITRIDEPSGLISNSERDAFSVFPNPANDNFVIQINDIESSNLILEIYDLNGRVVRKMVVPSEGNHYYRISTEGLSSGLHFVTLRNNANIIGTKRLIVAH